MVLYNSPCAHVVVRDSLYLENINPKMEFLSHWVHVPSTFLSIAKLCSERVVLIHTPTLPVYHNVFSLSALQT